MAWIIDLPLSPAAFVVGILSADMGGPAIATVALLVLGIVGVPYQVVLLRREGQTVGNYCCESESSMRKLASRAPFSRTSCCVTSSTGS